MRVRQWLSKLLLRHGRVYSGGHAWNGVHEVWLRRNVSTTSTPQPPLTITSTPC
jgi:hypothetical protein